MLCEPFVHERVIGVEQIQHRSVLAQDAFEQHFRLAHERLAQVVVEVRKLPRVRIGALEISQEQPLACEIMYQGVRLGVFEHPAGFAIEDGRFMQLALDRRVEKPIVGNARPKKEGKP